MGGGEGRWGIGFQIHKGSGVSLPGSGAPLHFPPPASLRGGGCLQRREPATGRKMVIWVRSPTSRGASARQRLDASFPRSAVSGFGAPAHPKRCAAGRGAALRLGAGPAGRATSPPTGSGRAPEQQGPLWVPGPGWRHQQSSFREEPPDPAPPASGAGAVSSRDAERATRSYDPQPLSSRTWC